MPNLLCIYSGMEKEDLCKLKLVTNKRSHKLKFLISLTMSRITKKYI